MGRLRTLLCVMLRLLLYQVQADHTLEFLAAGNLQSVTGGQTLLTHFMSQNKLDEVEKTLPPSVESPKGLAPQSFVEHSDPAIVAEALPSGASSPSSSPLTSLPASSNSTSHCSSPTPMKFEIRACFIMSSLYALVC